ncbi:putative leucine-rich repeat-containing protein DDB_G0290503 isoform X2 [Linepithema humile]|uniref:putative leucine-rich repeat-containing protein DDB_G0290503 isoform X2 n=1 Tax=Linepithema humile TaxID=83485 RepID=UPI000623ABD8|nr:PREDICTED: uncharacterized protein LOC105680066 isoform X1 [Linepithema humile]
MELVKNVILLNIPLITSGIFNVVKSTRAPRRLESVKDRQTMFYLDKKGAAAAARYNSSTPNEEENFGDDREIALSSGSHRDKDHRTFELSASISRIKSDDSDSCSFSQDASKQESGIYMKMELNSFQDDLDIDLIERDVINETNYPPTTVNNNECEVKEEFKPRAYTPERLIKSQKYRILTPSPPYFVFSKAKLMSEEGNDKRKYQRCRKRLNGLLDSTQIGATQLRTLLNISPTDVRTCAFSSLISGNEQCIVNDFNTPMKSKNIQNTETFSSNRSSYDRLNSTLDNYKNLTNCLSSLDDTSGIQSNDWSLETQSDMQYTPMSLCDELAIASRSHTSSFATDRSTAINEVMSILESLQSHPEKATILLKEDDRFDDCTSHHDNLTRLALAIETDEEVSSAVPKDPNNAMHHLREKIKRLRLGNKEIHRDICDLRTNFQDDEKKTIDLSNKTTKLLQDVRNLRYFDDLLKLLKGKLYWISKKKWPFVLGHSEPYEEKNLII